METSAKQRLAEAAVTSLAAVVRNVPHLGTKQFLWDRVYFPYFGWRKFEVEGRTFFGSSMDLQLPDSIQTNIFLSGYWEPGISDFVRASLVEGDTFIDIGANVGYYTLLASNSVGKTGKVYAIEASPSVFQRLARNAAKNKAQNVELLNVAVSNKPGTIWVWAASEVSANVGHATIMQDVAATDGHTREAEVKCDTLDALIPRGTLTSARLIKMDIEGAERLAIEGILPILNDFSSSTEWILELSPKFSKESAKDASWIYEAFTSRGYRAFRFHNSYDSMMLDSWKAGQSILHEMPSPPSDGLHDVLFSKQPRH